MNPSEFVSLKYKLSHAKTKEQRRAVIDSYPDLKGRSVKAVKDLLQAHVWVTTGDDFKEQKRKNRARFWAGWWRKNGKSN